MLRILLSTIVLLATIAAQAVTVRCEAGRLQALLGNNSMTELTLTGQMDARDFRTLADKCRNLRSLNLAGVTIVAYSSDKPLFGNVRDYRADVVPSLSLAQLSHLTTLVLPSHATSIGEGALAACTSLTSLTLPIDLTHLGDYALAGCTSLKSVSLPSKLKVIGTGALTGCTSLTEVTVSAPFTPGGTGSPFEQQPYNITHIGAQAFAGCSQLKTATLGNQIEWIGDAAFAGTRVTQADLSAMRSLTHIGDWAYAQTLITRAVIPASVTSLGWGAFVLSPSLASVALPSSLSAVPPLLLAGNDKLTAVDLSQSSADSIGAYALYNLSRVPEMTLPSTIQHLGTRAMAGMTGLQQIVSRAEAVPDLGEAVWQGINQPSVVLKVPAMSVDNYRNTEQWREFNVQSNALPGDANDDGNVDIADINAIINYMLGQVNGSFVFDGADVDGNGEIDIADINSIINMMLGSYLTLPQISTPNTGDMLAIDNFAITAGERHTIDVRLNDSRSYTALQCVIHLPDGLVPTGDVAVGSRTARHQVAWLASGNEVRIVLYALPNVDIAGSDDQPVLRLSVTASDALASLADITVDHVTLVTADGDIYYAPNGQAQVSKATGVTQVAQTSDRVYGANGVLHIIAADAGQAQLVSLSGMTRTVSVQAGSNSYHNIDPGYYIVRMNGCSYKVKI